MFEKIKNSFFNIFLLCVSFGLLFFVKVNSYADIVRDNTFHVTSYNGFTFDDYPYISSFDVPDNMRVCFYYNIQGYVNGASYGTYTLFTNYDGSVSYRRYVDGQTQSSTFSSTEPWDGVYALSPRSSVNPWGNNRLSVYSDNSAPCPIFNNEVDVQAYILNGVMPSLPYDNSLNLDEFKVWTYGVKDSLSQSNLHDYSNVFSVSWSDSRISSVKVRIHSTDRTEDFVGSASPFLEYWQARIFAHLNGDVITLTATPYKSDGTYGNSLYYSFVYEGNDWITNLKRKLVNTNHYDNTIEIPYNGNDVQLTVDGVDTNNVYKVHYNPVTNEYGDLNLYEVYYSPVIVYPSDMSGNDFTDTQEDVQDTYVTNNYYETTKNINLGFSFDIDNVTNDDAKDTFEDAVDFFKGFGKLIGKIADFFTSCFPFLSSAVATTIVWGFGILITLAIIVLIIKLIGKLFDFIPFL